MIRKIDAVYAYFVWLITFDDVRTYTEMNSFIREAITEKK